jgi:hypothetical protein
MSVKKLRRLLDDPHCTVLFAKTIENNYVLYVDHLNVILHYMCMCIL